MTSQDPCWIPRSSREQVRKADRGKRGELLYAALDAPTSEDWEMTLDIAFRYHSAVPSFPKTSGELKRWREWKVRGGLRRDRPASAESRKEAETICNRLGFSEPDVTFTEAEVKEFIRVWGIFETRAEAIRAYCRFA